MRLVDVVFRHGHVSEAALTAAVLDGTRLPHLDHCDLCARRALELGRWLDAVHTTAVEAADEAFPSERLAAQQSQIMRRLERLDEPARVISFRRPSLPAAPAAARRVAPGWVGVAAAAGLIVGVVGGQITARLNQSGGEVRVAGSTVGTPAASGVAQPGPAIEPRPIEHPDSIMEMDLERFTVETLQGIDEMTPRIVPAGFTVALR